LGVSLAAAKASAEDHGLPLWRYIGGVNAKQIPVPMANIVNGGKHADNKSRLQEFMVMPCGRQDFPDGIRMVAEVFHTLRVLKKAGHNTPSATRALCPQPRQRRGPEVHHGGISKAGYARPRQDLHRPRLRQLRAL